MESENFPVPDFELEKGAIYRMVLTIKVPDQDPRLESLLFLCVSDKFRGTQEFFEECLLPNLDGTNSVQVGAEREICLNTWYVKVMSLAHMDTTHLPLSKYPLDESEESLIIYKQDEHGNDILPGISW